jgi:hypothetical protein
MRLKQQIVFAKAIGKDYMVSRRNISWQIINLNFRKRKL